MNFKAVIVIPALFFSLLLMIPQARAQTASSPTGASAKAMMETFTKHFDNRDETSNAKMTLISKSGSRQSRDMTIKRKTGSDNLDKVMIRFSAPPDIRGTGLLTWEQGGGSEDQQWIYLPAIRKTKKISGGDKQDKFVGSDFTYEDLQSEDIDDHQYSIFKDSASVVVIDAIPNDKNSGYSRRRIHLRKDIYFVIGVEYFDKSGNPLKVMQSHDIVQAQGNMWRANRVEMKNVQSGHSTMIEVTSRQLNTGLPDGDFTKQSLERDA